MTKVLSTRARPELSRSIPFTEYRLVYGRENMKIEFCFTIIDIKNPNGGFIAMVMRTEIICPE